MLRRTAIVVLFAVWSAVPTDSVSRTHLGFTQPQPKTAGYIFILAVGTGLSVAGALLPAHLSWWWLDTVGHVAGGFTLALGLGILLDRKHTLLGVVVLSIGWELLEWYIGYPFHVTIPDTRLDLLAGWVGACLALLGTVLVRSRST